VKDLVTPSDKLLFGTSGWSYKEWIGPFYSQEDKSMLRAYTKVFNTAEIDSTFYRYPSKGIVMGWTKYSPEGFVYTAKLPRLITHEKKADLTQGVEEDLQKFLDLMEPLSLGGKLGCILIQLPPKFSYRPKEMEDFFKILPSHVKFAVEFRNHSWMRKETWALLEKYKVAYTVVDEPLLPPEVHLTSNIAYFRWHGRGTRPWYNYCYSAKELEPWIPKIEDTTRKAEKVFGYFNNHYHGHAVKNCLQMLEMLGKQTPQQAIARNKVEEYFKDRAKTKEFQLEAFAEPKKESFEELLRYFTAAGRLERAENIGDSELTITSQTDKQIEAAIREYHIIIDIDSRTILHDCADWSKISSTRKMCKHIAKLLIVMDREKATEVLKRIYEEKDAWQFEPYMEK
jgi:uncharacterized protein YecE (DUF72 family)